MEKKPLVSVITATYKRFDRLYDTIQSVLTQDYPNIEYIITDDGSDAFPEEKIRQYIQDNRQENVSYQIIHHKNNLGTVRNLNNAYKQANGEYIVNLSCGDIFTEEEIINRIVNRFIETDCEVLVTSRLLYTGDYDPICFLPHYEEREIITTRYKTGLDQYKAFITSRFFDMASGSAMYMKKDVIQNMGYYDEKYYLWEDGPFLAKYLLKGKLEYAYDIVSIWYETGGVSSDGVDNASPLMKKDIIYFIRHEKMNHPELLSHKERRLAEYRSKRIECGSSRKRMLIYLEYLPEWLYFMKYSRKREEAENKDKEMITTEASKGIKIAR